ncbi:MAG: GTP cyclohydrolase I FolE [Bacteroidota bacterium]|nr:GTP cyclohydrolase I FolE [Bacteroidota bacterium]
MDIIKSGTGINKDFGYVRTDSWNDESTKKLTEHYKGVIEALGENTEREGIKKTPLRIAKAMQFIMKGYNTDPKQILESALFKEEFDEMVIVKNIELYSMCEHHMLPFFGQAHIAYIPDGVITGLSKIARVVDAFSRRMQVQERLTQEITDCINETLKPKGVGVVIEAQHMCMQMRGIQKQNSITTTSSFRGAFRNAKTREEFIHLINSKLH